MHCAMLSISSKAVGRCWGLSAVQAMYRLITCGGHSSGTLQYGAMTYMQGKWDRVTSSCW